MCVCVPMGSFFYLTKQELIPSLKAVVPQEATECLLLFQFFFSRGPHI